MPRIIGFDLDDTLLPTARQYHRVMWQCGSIIDAALGVRSPHPKDILDFQQTTDIASIQQHGYAVPRFGESWVQTYCHFAAAFRVEVDPAVVDQLRQVAAGFSRGPFLPFSGVEQTLDKLLACGDTLHCISAGAGADDLQHRKLKESGLADYFTSIVITGSDKSAAMRRIFTDVSRSVMVGDSKSHDIKPALELGVHAVWVPSTSWSFIHADLDGAVYGTIRSVNELPLYLAQHPQLSMY